MKRRRHFGPWVEHTTTRWELCVVCAEGMPKGCPAYLQPRGGVLMCGSCGVKVLSSVFPMSREGVTT